MLKRLVREEGPYELDINRRFSTEPLYSNPKNHCAHLLDVIELPNDTPIMVHPLLRPFDSPPLQTFGEFVTFFAQICEVGSVIIFDGKSNHSIDKGVQFMHENHVAHRSVDHCNLCPLFHS